MHRKAHDRAAGQVPCQSARQGGEQGENYAMEYAEAENIFNCQKTLLGPFRWAGKSRSGREKLCLECEARSVQNFIQTTVIFRSIVNVRKSGSYTFQLECVDHSASQNAPHIPLYRLEVNPFRIHRNGLCEKEEISGMVFSSGQSHQHDFRESVGKGEPLPIKSCEIAVPVPEWVNDYFTGLRFTGTELKIQNIDLVPEPSCQGQLL